MPRIYLDNAATSWPKPEAVYRAVDRFQRDIGGSAGRSGHDASLAAGRVVEQARRAVAGLIGAADSRSVALTFNGTDALCLAIRGALRPGDHTVASVCEHNSVLRPLRFAEENLGCSVTLVDCSDDGVVDAEDVASALREETRLVAITHASNVTGAIQPIAQIAERIAGSGALLLVDAAQTAGHVPIDVERLGADLLAAPGHKGLLGPTGTGFLYVRPGVEQLVAPLRQGGTGSESESQRQPEGMPERYEAGNHNAVGLAGLAAGVEFLEEQGVDHLRERTAQLTTRLRCGLAEAAGCTVFGPAEPANRVGVVSATIDGYDPHELASILEASAGIQCRAGLQCAPAMHDRLGTSGRGGVLRFSPGFSTTAEEMDTVIRTVHEIVNHA